MNHLPPPPFHWFDWRTVAVVAALLVVLFFAWVLLG